jgi:hypothetical protein
VFLAACTGESVATGGGLVVSSHLSEAIPTVLVVEWSGAEPDSRVAVEWGTSADYGERTELGEGASGSGAVVGMQPGRPYHWRLVAEGGTGAESEDQEVTTGPAPDDLPTLTVKQKEEPVGGFALTNLLGSRAYAVLYDHDGEPVWWWSLEEPNAVFAENRVSADGRRVLLQVMDGSRATDMGELLSVDWAGEQVEHTRLEGTHHDFVTLPDGTVAWCAMDVRTTDIEGTPTAVVGEALRELPAGGDPEADVRTVWTSWDHLPMTADPETDTGFYPEGLDWIHCNGLAWAEDDDDYLMSSLSLGAVISIDRTSGDQNWVLGGDLNEFTFVGGEMFEQVHSPEPHAGGLRVFSNRNGGGDSGEPIFSQVLDYELDVGARVAREVDAVSLGRRYFSYILGDSNALSDDHLLVSWGSAGVLTEVNAARDLVWAGSLPIGNVAGFTENVPTAGGPLTAE